jgi:hypothetical protein
LLTALRDRLPFGEVPIKLYLRKREESRGEKDLEERGPAELAAGEE